MELQDKNSGILLGKIGREFRRNIEDHIKDYRLQKGNDVEWFLEPLDAISHSADIVIDAFEYGSRWDSFYQLYFHDKNADLSIFIGKTRHEVLVKYDCGICY